VRVNNQTKALLVLRNTDQLSIINDLAPEWAEESLTVISGHPTVDIELRQQGVPFDSLYDVVPLSLFNDSEAEVNELTDIFTGILGRLWPNEPVMLEGLRPTAQIVAQDFVRSKITTETLLSELKPQGIWIVSQLSVPRLLDVELSSDIFDAMLLHHAESKGLDIRLIRQSTPAPGLWRRLRDFLKSLKKTPDKAGTEDKDPFIIPPKTSRRRIMLLGADFDFENQLPLVQRLNESGKAEAIHVYLGGPAAWLKDSTNRYMAEHPEAWVDYPRFRQQHPTPPTELRPDGDFREELQKTGLKWQEWLSSPYLDFQFRWLFEEAPRRVLRNAEEWSTFFGAYQPDIVVLIQDSTHYYVGQPMALKRLGIKSALVPHSAIVNATPAASRFLSDHAFVWGEIMRDECVEIGVAPDRLIITGTIKEMKTFVQLNDKARRQRLETLGLSPDRKTLVMVTSGSFERWMRPYVDVKTHLASIEAAIRHVMQRPDAQLVIKTHPRRDYPAVYHDMISRLGTESGQADRVKVIVKDDLFSVLAVADAIISPSTHTTASLEALITEQPMVYIATARIYDKRFSWLRHGGCLVVNALEDIPASLDRVLDDASLREKLIAEGRTLLHKYYEAEDGEAIARISELLMGAEH